MPSATQILARLAAIARDWRAVAVAWHAAIALVALAAARGWRPSHRHVAGALAVPCASVALLAGAYGNPVNGAVFAGAAVACEVAARRASAAPVAWATGAPRLAGLALLAYAWLYPHFLPGDPRWYLVAAPVGLVPCPTLALAAGVALLAGAGLARWLRWLLAGLAAADALFGALVLGVALDAGLLAGAAALGATLVSASRRGGAARTGTTSGSPRRSSSLPAS